MSSDWPFHTLTPLKYGAILADPPWAYEMRSERGYAKSPEAHYSTMNLKDIKALPVAELASKDCLLFLWSTWPHLTQALEVMNAWGFEFVTGGAWIKRTRHWKACFGTGYAMRSASEPFLIGKMGKPMIRSKSERNIIEAILDDVEHDWDEGDIEPPNWELQFDLDFSIQAIRREHSRKPDEMRQVIERLLPDVFCAELFAREAWAGNDVWGNEIDKFECKEGVNNGQNARK